MANDALPRVGTTTSWGIPQLVAEGAAGRIKVPTFQRSFVWDAVNVRELFDSIYKGFPIGTFLVWESPEAVASTQLGGANEVEQSHVSPLLVVDGQQRLTSLVSTLSQGDERDERFQVYFDLERKKFVGPSRGGRPFRSIPLSETLESRRLLSWLRDHADELEDGDLDVADELGGALRDYKAAVYIVRDSSEKVLREVFDRVNSAGKPISRAQIFHALFASQSPGASPQAVSDHLERLGFGLIDEGRVVQSLLAIRGGDVARDLHSEFEDGEDPAEWYDLVERALEAAILFLRDQGVLHVLLMPNTLPLPVLAAFFHLHTDPSGWELRQLSRWLWRGWISGFGTEGGQTPVLRRSIRAVNPSKLDREAAPTAADAIASLLAATMSSPTPPLPRKLDTKSALGRLALLSLAELGPRRRDGEAIDVAAELDREGVAAIGMLVEPGSKADIGRRGFWQPTWGRLTGQESLEVLASQAVNPGAAASLRRGDYDDFADKRYEAIAEIFAIYARRRLDAPIAQIPPNQVLINDD